MTITGSNGINCLMKFRTRRDGYGEHAEPFLLEAWTCALAMGGRGMPLT